MATIDTIDIININILIGSILFLLIVLYSLKLFIEALFSYRWSKVRGIITYSSTERITEFTLITPEDEYTSGYLPKIEYTYDVDGKEYQSNRIRMGYKKWGGSMKSSEKDLDKYPAGKEVTVYYNSKDPEKASLEVGFNLRLIDFPLRMFLLVLVVLAIITFVLVILSGIIDEI
jgi:hypothetical protein